MNIENDVVEQLKTILEQLQDMPLFTSWCVGIHDGDKTDFIGFIDKIRAIQGITNRDLIENFDSYLKMACGMEVHENLSPELYELNLKIVSALIYANRGEYYDIG
ncbi:hypothetical protein [Vibrio lentus]|uniref:hypothetical protein n=1 Tax=Vibrio lentus TaxID=136468 RepID=UPI000C84B439|nr:hypothetical protein [Vibrio lentus]PML07659.1 hypothetical protein BCT85_20275 [Vibrio lentus]